MKNYSHMSKKVALISRSFVGFGVLKILLAQENPPDHT